MQIKIRHLVYFELIYTLFMMQWMTYFGISNIKVLIPDIVNILIILAYGKRVLILSKKQYMSPLPGILIGFLVISILGSFFGETFNTGISGLILGMWDIRIIFRPFLFLGFCIIFLSRRDVEKIFRLFYKLQFVNVVLALFQYYAQGYWMDVNGGIFAPVQGCNKYSNVFCSILLIWVLVRYMKGKVGIKQVLLTCMSTVIIAIYAELKFLFIEMILLIFLCIIFSGRSSKMFRSILIGAIVAYFGLDLLASLFPSSFQILTDTELFMWYAKDMSYSNTAVSVNRLSGFDVINEYMFKGSILRELFGYGWGATGQIPFLNLFSGLIAAYGSLSYVTFTYSWVYAELGLVGIVCFYGAIIGCLIPLIKRKNRNDKDGFIAVSKVAVLLVILLSIYDSSWMTEGTTFLCAFAMAVGYIEIKEQENENYKPKTV